MNRTRGRWLGAGLKCLEMLVLQIGFYLTLGIALWATHRSLDVDLSPFQIMVRVFDQDDGFYYAGIERGHGFVAGYEDPNRCAPAVE